MTGLFYQNGYTMCSEVFHNCQNYGKSMECFTCRFSNYYFFNFGYVALTIKHVTTHDIGVYTCRAYNRIGQATTSAQLTVVSKKDIILDSQHPGGLEKIHYLEDTR